MIDPSNRGISGEIVSRRSRNAPRSPRRQDRQEKILIAFPGDLGVLAILAQVFLPSVFLAAQASARDIYVDPTTGKDTTEGGTQTAPVKTIARAVKLAGPGDTIHLAAAIYKESAEFHNKSGEAERPIILDGHGATLDGCDLLIPADWQQVSPGLYRNDHLLKVQDFVIMRWFFLFDGKMNHMGRTSKGTKAPLKNPADLKNDEWTYAESEKSFYIRIDPQKNLADAHIAAPIRSAGVAFSGTCEHFIIRNLTCTHVYNDGFNIHGHCHNLLFQNIRAIECGDDGFSEHEDCSVKIDGFESIANSTGICNINQSISENNRVLIKDCLAYDLFFLDGGKHTVTNSLILSSSEHPIVVSGRTKENQQCTLKLQNVLLKRAPGERSSSIEVGKGGILDADHVTSVGAGLRVSAFCTWTHSVISAPTAQLAVLPTGTWKPDDNLYDVRSINIGEHSYKQDQFADYQSACGDAKSRWASLGGSQKEVAVTGIGANVSEVPASK